MNKYLLEKQRTIYNINKINTNLINNSITVTLGYPIQGRLGNQIIRNLCTSIIAEKFNLFVKYSSYDLITSLGINLFIGSNKYNNKIKLTDDNFFSILNNNTLDSNLDPNDNYFITIEITNYLYNYIHQENIKNNIIEKNQFKDRINNLINNNVNDCFIHIRLTDLSCNNPGINYYLKALSKITFDKLYIASDDINNLIIKDICSKYNKFELVLYDEIKTIQFANTCKNVILSQGSFSLLIGFLSFYSNIYYPKFSENHNWYNYNIPSWNLVEF
jgi:hypothetical protein